MTETWSEAATDLSDETVREMVESVRPDWTVSSIARSEHGTDFVGFLDVETQAGAERVVLKATTADFVDPEVARAEPRLFALLNERTSIPVPAVHAVCDDHGSFPTPFYLVEYVDGESFEGGGFDLDEAAVQRVLREAGAHLAALHELGPLDAAGDVGVTETGAIDVLDTADHPAHSDQLAYVIEGAMETLDALEDGGFFPEMADDPERFADLVPELRERVRSMAETLDDPALPTYCHWDYRWGNLLVDPKTGEINAVLDWANLSSSEPAYNLAKVESHMLDAGDPAESTIADRRRTFRRAYAEARTTRLAADDAAVTADDAAWEFTDAIRDRMALYTLVARLDAMACLPLWHREKSPAERDAVEDAHRDFLTQYR